MKKFTLYREGNCYKGNLHIHTTLSDGEKTPEEIKDVYKNNGYSFVAITDHNKYGIFEELNDENFLVLPGIEIDSFPEGNVHHVVGIGDPESTGFEHGYIFDDPNRIHYSAQQLVDFLVTRKNFAIYAHPAWSYTNLYEFRELKGLLGVEVINYSCEQESKRGNSDIYFEQICTKNNDVWCFGSDDAHGHVDDYCGGYITVKAAEFTHKGILQAIKDGSFYASYLNSGEKAPEILDFYVEDGVAKLWCTPCKSIHINGSRKFYYPTLGDGSDQFTYTEVNLRDGMDYVRAILTDSRGNMTWSQPIKLQ